MVQEIGVRVAHDSSVSRVSRQIFIKGCRPLRGLELVSDDVPGVRPDKSGLTPGFMLSSASRTESRRRFAGYVTSKL